MKWSEIYPIAYCWIDENGLASETFNNVPSILELLGTMTADDLSSKSRTRLNIDGHRYSIRLTMTDGSFRYIDACK